MIKVRKQIQLPSIEESKMSIDLVNSVVNSDYVLANDLFEERLANILEKKLYERKRMIAAEAFGGLTQKEIEDRKKRGFVPASTVLRDPRDIKIPLRKKEDKKKKRVSEETLDEAGLGDAVRSARALQQAGPAVVSQFRAAMALKRLGRGNRPTPKQQTNRPGMIRRNINTLMGREPGYVDTRTPEEKMMQKGGRGGKVIRAVGKGIVGAASEIGSQLAPSGF